MGLRFWRRGGGILDWALNIERVREEEIEMERWREGELVWWCKVVLKYGGDVDEMGTKEMWIVMRRGSWHSSPLLALVGVARLASVVSGCGRARERERETYRASEREQVI